MSTQICTFPISPPYLPTHRYLYYTTLLLSLLYPTPPPLIKGAFALSLTYTSTASIHAIVIACLSAPTSNQLVNLDVPTLWAILTPATLSVCRFRIGRKRYVGVMGAVDG